MRPTINLPGTDQPINGDRPGDRRTNDQKTDKRVTVADAAVLMGISEDAVRSRLRRGTLRRETGQDGTVFVLLGASPADRQTSNKRSTNDRPYYKPSDRKTTDQDAEGYSASEDSARGELLEVLRGEVAHLRHQLDQEREANRENRRIIAGLVQRVPEIEGPRDAHSQAPPEPLDGSETASPRPDSGTVPEGPQEPAERRSWLYRFFFGP